MKFSTFTEKLAKNRISMVQYTAFSLKVIFLLPRYKRKNMSTAAPQYIFGQWSSPISVPTFPI